MFTFLRRIRRRLIAEHRLRDYLLYAIGEIVLVVVGILIALQINLWNEGRKRIRNEAEVLVSLQNEIIDNMSRLERIRHINDSLRTHAAGVLEDLRNGSDVFSVREIKSALDYHYSTVDAPVLTGLIASNSSILVKRKDLIPHLRALKVAYERIEKSEDFLNELWNSKVTSFFIACGLPYESYSEYPQSVTLADIELGGYSRRQFLGLITLKLDAQRPFDSYQDSALVKSEAVLRLLNLE